MTNNIETLNELQILARYNRWANDLLFHCVENLNEKQYHADMGLFFSSIHNTLNHILVGDRLWTSRISGEYHGISGLDEILHEDFKNLSTARTSMDDHIVRLTDRMSVGLDGGLDKEVLYRTVSGGNKHASPARHIFLTLFNHQTHHRGQIHAALTQTNIKDIPELDVIFYIRDASSDA